MMSGPGPKSKGASREISVSLRTDHSADENVRVVGASSDLLNKPFTTVLPTTAPIAMATMATVVETMVESLPFGFGPEFDGSFTDEWGRCRARSSHNRRGESRVLRTRLHSGAPFLYIVPHEAVPRSSPRS